MQCGMRLSIGKWTRFSIYLLLSIFDLTSYYYYPYNTTILINEIQNAECSNIYYDLTSYKRYLFNWLRTEYVLSPNYLRRVRKFNPHTKNASFL